jgi:hypothetical protein
LENEDIAKNAQYNTNDPTLLQLYRAFQSQGILPAKSDELNPVTVNKFASQNSNDEAHYYGFYHS